MPDAIRVEGLAEFRKSLKAIDSELPKGIRVASNKAADLIVADSVPKVPRGPGKGGHAASSIKARSTSTAARVTEGGKKFPYMPWLDFGGKVGPRKTVRRPFIKTGRFIWKSFDDLSDDVTAVLSEQLQEIATRAGIGVDE